MLLCERRRRVRRGAAVVEFACLLPLLVFLFVVGVDFARVYYPLVTITNASRTGAIWASQDVLKAADVEGIRKVVLDDAKNLTPAPTVTSVTGTDELGEPYVRVTVTWEFTTVSQFPGIPSPIVLSRTSQMRVAPKFPKGST